MSKPKPLGSLNKSLNNLSLTKAPTNSTQKAPTVADSWDEEASSDSDSNASSAEAEPSSPTHKNASSYTKAPPPTPAILSPSLPSHNFTTTSARTFQAVDSAFDSPMQKSSSSADSAFDRRGAPSPSTRDPDKRPEKSTAVASRLIAAGLGVKAPRRTEEQREYDRAVRAQERRRKEREIEERNREKDRVEKAKAAVWDD